MTDRLSLQDLKEQFAVRTADRTERELHNLEAFLEFYHLALVQGKPEEAVERFIGAEYIQHDPNVADGGAAFVDFVYESSRRSPDGRFTYRNVFVDGDFVVCHALWYNLTNESFTARAPGQNAVGAVDVFRFEDGKIVEHWDVIQPVPEHSANDNDFV